MIAFDGFAFMTAIGTVVVAVVVVGGAFVGIRYNRKAVNLTVETAVYRYEDFFMMSVKPSVGSAGVLPFKVHQSAIRIFEITTKVGANARGDVHHGNDQLLTGSVIRGKETKGMAEPIYLPMPDGLIGWLTVVVVRGKHGEPWLASTFQPVPPKEAAHSVVARD